MNLTELLCSENLSNLQGDEFAKRIEYNLEVQSRVDLAMLADTRVIANMMADEREATLVDYCNNGMQPAIKPHMRKIVADWMLEVCEDQQCVPHVFHTAVNYMDRFLSSFSLDKKYYQSMAAGCLLLASKFTEVRPLSTEKLSLYTDHSVLPEELKQWELKILNVLNWELSAITTQSFIDHFIHPTTTTTSSLNNSHNIADQIRRHADILSASAATEYKFLLVRPSLMAAAALSAACRGLAVPYTLPHQLTDELNSVNILVDHLETLLDTCLNNANTQAHAIVHTDDEKVAKCQKPVYSQSRDETRTPTEVHQAADYCGSSTTLPPFYTIASSNSYQNCYVA